MKKLRTLALSALAFLGLSAPAMAEEFGTADLVLAEADKAKAEVKKDAPPMTALTEDCDKCDKPKCGGCIAEIEATIFKYHRIGGMQTGVAAGDEVDNAFDAGPRITLGYVGPGGSGVRARWWEFTSSHNGVADPAAFIDVDTYTFDVEAFHTAKLGECWSLEVSGGLRYNGFRETLFTNADDPVVNSFYGFGGLFGIESRRALGNWGALYGRARLAVLMDDKSLTDEADGLVIYKDAVLGMIELAFGYEFSRTTKRGGVVFGRVGAEWQNWYNYSSNPEVSTDFSDQEGSSDVGFAGITLSIGLRR